LRPGVRLPYTQQCNDGTIGVVAMKFRLVALCMTACVVAGCTNDDWDHAFSYVGMDQAPQASVPPPSEAAPAQAPALVTAVQDDSADKWCKDVAAYERNEAGRQGFDSATQQHVYQSRYAQCMSDPRAPQR
jgi:hypothetical protein